MARMPMDLAVWEGEIYPVIAMGDVMVTLQVRDTKRVVFRSEVILITDFLRAVGFTFWKGYDGGMEPKVQS